MLHRTRRGKGFLLINGTIKLEIVLRDFAPAADGVWILINKCPCLLARYSHIRLTRLDECGAWIRFLKRRATDNSALFGIDLERPEEWHVMRGLL